MSAPQQPQPVTASASSAAPETTSPSGTPDHPSAGGGRHAGQPGAASPGHRGPGVVKRTTNNVKRILLIVIGALIALFAVVNSQKVDVHWIFGDSIQTPLILVIGITLIAGMVIGWIGAKLGSRAGGAHNG